MTKEIKRWKIRWTPWFGDSVHRNYKVICPCCDFSYLDNHCGMINPSEFNYCPNCGERLEWNAEEAKKMEEKENEQRKENQTTEA